MIKRSKHARENDHLVEIDHVVAAGSFRLTYGIHPTSGNREIAGHWGMAPLRNGAQYTVTHQLTDTRAHKDTHTHTSTYTPTYNHTEKRQPLKKQNNHQQAHKTPSTHSHTPWWPIHPNGGALGEEGSNIGGKNWYKWVKLSRYFLFVFT